MTRGHIRAEAQAVPRRGLLLVVAILLLIAWAVAAPSQWGIGVAAAALGALGAGQMLGRIPRL